MGYRLAKGLQLVLYAIGFHLLELFHSFICGCGALVMTLETF
jgi:hypothetical protein